MSTGNNTIKGFLPRALLLGAGILLLGLLTSCATHEAEFDMMRSMANGDINREKIISATELQQILYDHFGRVQIRFSDTEYTLPDNGKVAQLGGTGHCEPGHDNVIRPKDWDCDDYAIAALVPLRNYAFGAMFVTTENGRRHALNVFVNYKKEVVYWEPQTCQYFHGRFYKPDLILF